MQRGVSDLILNYPKKERWKMHRIGFILIILASSLIITSRAPCEQHGVTGVTKTQILIGATAPLTGRFSAMANEIKIGAQTYFNFINENGGVHGRKLKYIVYDDQFKPATSKKNVERLIKKDKVFSLFCTFGTNANLAILPLIKQYKIPLFSPISFSTKLVGTFNHYVFFIYPDYYIQAGKLANYSISQFKNKKPKVSMLYLTPFYYEGFQGTKEALGKKDLSLLDTVAMKPGEKDLSPYISRLKYGSPDVVILFTQARQAGLFVNQSLAQKWKPLFLLGPSPMITDEYIKAAGRASEGTIAISAVPNPWTSNNSGVLKYKYQLEAYSKNYTPSFFSLMGYTSAYVFVEGLRKAGAPLTIESFIKGLETLKEHRTNIGYPVSFSAKNHLATTCLLFNKVVDGKFVEFMGYCTGTN